MNAPLSEMMRAIGLVGCLAFSLYPTIGRSQAPAESQTPEDIEAVLRELAPNTPPFAPPAPGEAVLEPSPAVPAPERIELIRQNGAGTNPDHVTLTLTDTELLQVVELFIRVSGANIIAAPTNLTGRVTVSLRDVPWQTALSAILDMHNLALVQGGPDADVYSIVPKPEGAPDPVFIENFHLNFLQAETLSDAVKGALEPSGRVLLAQGNRLSVMGTAPKIRDVRKLVEELDRRVPQVVVESKFVELNEQAIKDLGINWQVLQGLTTTLQSPTYQITRETVTREMDQDARVRTSSDSFGTQTSRGRQTTQQTDIPSGVITGTVTDNNAAQSSDSRGGSSATITGSNFSEYDDGAMTIVPPRTLTDTRALSAVLSATDLALTLSALKQNTGVDIISNPKIIVSSGESASIHVGERRPNVVRKLQSTAGGASEIIYEFGDPQWIDIGVKVQVTPTVNTERNITLRIVPELDRQVGVVEPTPGLTFPILVTRRIESEFALESGKTVAIGGLTQTTDREVVRKIPFLGDIPILGKYLFSHSSTERRQDEVIIFVTVALANSETLDSESGIPSQGRLISTRFIDPSATRLQLRGRGRNPERAAEPPGEAP